MTNLFSAPAFAASYALDILEEPAAFESDLAASKSLQAELTTFASAVSELAYGVPPVTVPTGLKQRLFDNIGASEADDSIADLWHSRSDGKLPYNGNNVHHPQPPVLNRPIERDLRSITVGIQP